MIKIILGTDIKTGEVIPDQPVVYKKNMADYIIDKEVQTILLVSENNEIDDFKKLSNFNFFSDGELVAFSLNGIVFCCENIDDKTIQRYKIGKPIYLAIVNKRREIIARYEMGTKG